MERNRRKIGRKTRRRLRDAGVSAEITERADLTPEEAHAALYASKDGIELEDHRDELRMIEHSVADEPTLTLEQARHLVRQLEHEIEHRRCGTAPGSDSASGCELLASRPSEGRSVLNGSSFRQDALKRSFEAREDSMGFVYLWAVLRPDPENRHDPNAVAVDLDGSHVGFLGSNDADLVQENLLRLDVRGYRLTVPIRLAQNRDNSVSGELLWQSGDELPRVPKKPPMAAAPPVVQAQGADPVKKNSCLVVGCGAVIFIGIVILLLALFL